MNKQDLVFYIEPNKFRICLLYKYKSNEFEKYPYCNPYVLIWIVFIIGWFGEVYFILHEKWCLRWDEFLVKLVNDVLKHLEALDT